MRIIYLDGQYLKTNDQLLDAYTPGVLKASGVFETMLGVDGVVMDTAMHLKRLRSGLKALNIQASPIDASILKEVLVRNHLSLARVRLMVWKTPQQIHVMAAALPYKNSPKKIYKVCIIPTDREANDRFADLKSLNYELYAKAYAQAKAHGFDEALLLNKSGYIFEASRANIFWIKDKVLYTTPLSSGCLNGITRQQVISQAKQLKIAVKEIQLTADILKKSDSAFLTNSLSGIKPIETAVDKL